MSFPPAWKTPTVRTNSANRYTYPLYSLSDEVQVLELWRGPTCAFKDMALQILPHLLTVSAAKTRKNTKIVILVATSGDTGKAALEGFRDVENTQFWCSILKTASAPCQKLQIDHAGGRERRWSVRSKAILTMRKAV